MTGGKSGGHSRQKVWGSRNRSANVSSGSRPGPLYVQPRTFWRKEEFGSQNAAGTWPCESLSAVSLGCWEPQKAFGRPGGLLRCVLREDIPKRGWDACSLVTWLHYLKKAGFRGRSSKGDGSGQGITMRTQLTSHKQNGDANTSLEEWNYVQKKNPSPKSSPTLISSDSEG